MEILGLTRLRHSPDQVIFLITESLDEGLKNATGSCLIHKLFHNKKAVSFICISKKLKTA